MAKEEFIDRTIDDSDYPQPLSKKSKLVLLITFIFVMAFLLSFPVMKILDTQIRSALASNRACPLDFESLDSSLFMPKVLMKNISVPAGCLSSSQKPFTIQDIAISFGGINFSPLSLVFNLNFEVFHTPLEIKITGSMSQQFIRIINNKIPLQRLTENLGQSFSSSVRMSGNMVLNGDIALKQLNPDVYKLSMLSEDFTLPGQNISGFVIDELDLRKFILEVKGKANNIEITQFQMGEAGKDVFLQGNGTISLDPADSSNSPIDLNLKLEPSSAFTEKFAVIKLLLANFTTGPNVYEFALKGTLAAPMPTPK